MSKKHKIAITGGIGAGKSLAARFIEEQGYLVIKADDVSKYFLFKDKTVQQNLIEVFGDEVVKDKEINVPFLRNVIFSSEENTRQANSILHPPTIKKISELMVDELLIKDLVFVEAALIFEANMEYMFDEIILVTSVLEDRYKRVMSRDDKTKEQIDIIISKQMGEEEKKAKSTIILENNSDISTFQQKTKEIIEKLENQ